MEFAKNLYRNLLSIRENSPLIHNITNFVVMNLTANALLALGASPVMAHAGEEVEEMVALSDALVLNIGTLSIPWIHSMRLAIKSARRLQKPIILDPVGAGATRFRTEIAQRLLREAPPTVLRGNSSEILNVAGYPAKTKGVDSGSESLCLHEISQELSRQYDVVICASGPKDLIVYKNQSARLLNGHPLMAKTTGMGCVATSLIGAFHAVNQNKWEATIQAMALMGIAGEIAAEEAQGPGSFIPRFLDSLYNLRLENIENRLQLELL